MQDRVEAGRAQRLAGVGRASAPLAVEDHVPVSVRRELPDALGELTQGDVDGPRNVTLRELLRRADVENERGLSSGEPAQELTLRDPALLLAARQQQGRRQQGQGENA